MRIIKIMPGSGGTFYCENCIRDQAIVRTLMQAGHDVTVVPLYLPVMEEAHDLAGASPIFFGAVRTYLSQFSKTLAHRPQSWLARWLDRPAMLNVAAKRAGSTDAAGLEALTISMLQGENGRQREELARLVDWLQQGPPVDVVHVSNALLIGLAGELRRKLQARIVCSLQDEDQWVDAMDELSAKRVWNAIAERAKDVDHFLSVGKAYGQKIAAKLKLSPDRWSLLPVAIDVQSRTPSPLPLSPPVVGYLSRLSRNLGLMELVEAVLKLRATDLPDLQMKAMGGSTPADAAFLRKLRRKIKRAGAENAITFSNRFDPEAREQFLSGLTVLSVPMQQGEALGLFQIESLAAGVPVLQPDAPGFREFVQRTGGGELFNPQDTDDLARKIASLLQSPQRLKTLSRNGRAAIQNLYAPATMINTLLKAYAPA